MKLAGIILAAGIGLVALKAGIVLAAILTPAVLMWLAVSHPRAFWGHAILFSLIVWANAHPVAGLIAISAAISAGMVAKYRTAAP